jgi:predicted flap endonuclease-1-like 5' DNA nuclease
MPRHRTPLQGATAEPNPAIAPTATPVFEPVAPTIETIPERPAPPTPRPTPTPAPPNKDDFALIRGIDEAAQDVLAAAGIRTFAALGALKAEDVRRLDETLGSRGRIARENWIEQAQMLAANKTTAHARQLGGASGIQLAAPTLDEGEPLTIDGGACNGTGESSPSPDAVENVEVAATVATAAAITSQPAPVEPVPPAELVQATPRPTGETSSISPNEDLQSISGITPEINQLLNARGVRRYAQIAGWSNNDISHIETLLGVPGRITNENWIAQARALAGEQASETSQPTEPEHEEEPEDLLSAVEPPATSSLVGLRSVKSPAFTGGQDASPAAHSGQLADLKRIRGIGVMIEKKLHMLGIHSYEQIANWTRSDIDRVSHELDFKGRIERENWVEQARILVAGGQTNFSRRFDTRPPALKPGANGSGN